MVQSSPFHVLSLSNKLSQLHRLYEVQSVNGEICIGNHWEGSDCGTFYLLYIPMEIVSGSNIMDHTQKNSQSAARSPEAFCASPFKCLQCIARLCFDLIILLVVSHVRYRTGNTYLFVVCMK